jgi:hypothetical protein
MFNKLTNTQLQDQLAEMTKRATDAEARGSKLAADLEKAIERGDKEAKARKELAIAHETLQTEHRTLSASLKAYKGSATKARSEVTVLKKQISPETRKIGAMRPPRTEEEAAERAAALEAAFAGDTTELVYSDGKREIRELAPLTITGDAWRETPHGRVLNHEAVLEPGDCQRQEMTLAGFALLNEAGDQVGYCALPDPILIGRNQRFQLPHNTIRF